MFDTTSLSKVDMIIEIALRLRFLLLRSWALSILGRFKKHLKICTLISSFSRNMFLHNQLGLPFFGMGKKILDEEVDRLPANRRMRFRGDSFLILAIRLRTSKFRGGN